MDTKALATQMARYHGTRDPARIAAALGYILIDTPLEGIRGFYQYVNRCHIIYVDNNLPGRERCWVYAHELGHSLLHKGMNRIFMDTHTYMVTSRYEKEADRFAVDLLFDDYDLQDFLEYSTPTVAECLGISYELAEYRMGSVNPRLFRG